MGRGHGLHAAHDKTQWDRTLLIMVPDWITATMFDAAVERDEAGLLRRMHDEFIPGHGLRMVGRHHEIYLSDPRRVEPGRRRTILRQPVADARATPA